MSLWNPHVMIMSLLCRFLHAGFIRIYALNGEPSHFFDKTLQDVHDREQSGKINLYFYAHF